MNKNKVIRDSVHGDIELFPEEMQLIHTRSFQRLRGLRQLGLTHLVYPAAKHARFEHVLGVMHMAVQIAHRLDQGDFFKNRQDLLRTLRFAALLHDMGHVPFGHTLEDEMPIINKHDEPSEGSTRSRMEAAVSETLRESGNIAQEKPVLQVLRAIHASKEDSGLYKLVDEGKIEEDHVVLADIIGNTICADLLDYIKRDHMMTGIRATYDDRILQYFGVGEHRAMRPVTEDSKTKEAKDRKVPKIVAKSYKRVVIRLVRRGRVRNDALADLLDILKLRYNLSDKVLFHPQKCSADAMLIKALSELGLQEGDLLEYSDDALLHEHRDHPLIKKILSRDLFKPVFCCGMDNVSSYNQTFSKDELAERLRQPPDLRTKIEREIETALGLAKNEDSVLVYCPKPKMTLKPVRVLVEWKDGTIRRLNEITKMDDPVTFEQVEILQDIYPRLWKLYVFVPSRLRSRGSEIQQQFQGVLRDGAGLVATCDPAFQFYLDNWCWDYQMGPALEVALGNKPAYTVLPKEKRLSAVARCHKMYWDQPRPGGVDDSFGSAESVVAKRDVVKLAEAIADAVMAAPEPPEKPPTLLQ